jgi:tryptophanyl-tRNA synthetase
MKVTPYEASGKIDYDKLVKEFGVSRLSDDLKQKLGNHHMLRRDIFFAHRDLKWILDEYQKGNKFFLYTGRGPSGNTHMGHIIPWMFTKWLQDTFDVDLYFQMTDDEKFMFKQDLTLEETQKMALDNALDVIALGFKKGKTHIIIDSMHAGILYPLATKVAKKITFSTVKSTFGFGNDMNIGSIFFTAMQAVPAFLPSVLQNKKIPCLIPHAIDQDPHFRISRDIIPKLGYDKPASIQCRFLPGLTSDGKMSTTTGEQATIFVTDDPKTVKKKINKYAFSGGKETVEEHRKKGGNADIDVAYQWLTFLEEDDAKLKKIYDDYTSGTMLSGELKAILIEKVNTFLAEHQKKREQARNVLDDYILKM